MKYVDFSSLFDTDPAYIALLSTYQFDPDYFERRLLRCQTLAKARRIVVFVDAGQWQRLLHQEVPARLVNRRYLVVPVRAAHGVFHPKLNLLLTERGGQVHCGSANLTRCGCSSNLELLNAVPFGGEDSDDDGVCLALEAYRFFERACDDADEESGRIARQWLEETRTYLPWMKQTTTSPNRRVRLLHTYDGKLWDQLTDLLDSPPTRLQVISPFHDRDGKMFRRAHERWPVCRFEVLVQQKITALPVKALGDLRPSLNLFELRISSRRLHAKLLAWESDEGRGCLVGSANFTAAAFDSRNVEACLLLSDAGELLDSLFDDELSIRPLRFEDFEAGSAEESDPVEATSGVKLVSALLLEDGQLRVRYQVLLNPKPESLCVAIRTPGEALPRATATVRNTENGSDTVSFDPSVFRDAHGTILASLIARVAGGHQESAPVWVIQEHRLTYEPSGERSSGRQKIEETGEGLAEFLDEIGKREGVAAVIEYLRHLNIRFNDGGAGLPVGRKFRLQPHDPFQADVAPEWLLQSNGASESLASAIMDFVERHKRTRLARHASSGNVNGRENFLHILTTIVGLVYVYHVREKIGRGSLVEQVIDCIELATADPAREGASSKGYLFAVADNLRDRELLRTALDSVNFTGHIWAALMIAQKVRFMPNESDRFGAPPKRARECLPLRVAPLRAAFAKLRLGEPSWRDVEEALQQYRMFSEEDLTKFRNEWAGR